MAFATAGKSQERKEEEEEKDNAEAQRALRDRREEGHNK
jgi:hypothetical protein